MLRREWGNGEGLTSRRILSWLLVAVVMVGTDKRGGARDGGGIGRGELDGVERLAVLVSGDCGPALEQVIRFNGADSVNEGGGTFSWFDKGSVVGNGVLSLVNTGVEGEAIDTFFVVVYVMINLKISFFLAPQEVPL